MAKIETISDKIVCTETEITITNEKLKNTLSNIYETAREDANKRKWYNYFTVGFRLRVLYCSLFLRLHLIL